MAETSTKRKRTTKTRGNVGEGGDTEALCHIHDQAYDWELDLLRRDVCVHDVDLIKHTDGKYYCIFHLPSDGKDTELFETKFRERLAKIEEAIAEARDLPKPEGRRETTIWTRYDFWFVWFPSSLNLRNYTFLAAANFRLATFSARADLRGATFSDSANFSSAIFAGPAYFSSATFKDKAHFDCAEFSADANFRSATFSADADFSSAKLWAYTDFNSAAFSAGSDFSSARFSSGASFVSATFAGPADFRSATFSTGTDFSSAAFASDVYFTSAAFLDLADFTKTIFSSGTYFTACRFSRNELTNFHGATFSGDTFFDRARFRQDVSFNGTIFDKESDVFFRRAFINKKIDLRYATSEGYLRFGQLRLGRDNIFDLQEAAFEKASRVSFHTFELRPNWFVNVDARKFVFTDVRWRNRDPRFGNENIKQELAELEKRGLKERKIRLFEVAARQLAVNAEDNNRYNEAALFRYMAMETRRMEYSRRKRYFNLYTLYKWSSGYGERWVQAALVLLGIWIVCGLYYGLLGSFQGVHPDVWQAMGISSQTMLFQKTDIQTASNATFTVRSIQMVLSPLQAALLALAIRRKFMR